MAAERRRRGGQQLIIDGDQPLTGLVQDEGDREVTHYFTDDEEVDALIQGDATAAALALAGAWSDLDWETMKDELDRLRHETRPSHRLVGA